MMEEYQYCIDFVAGQSYQKVKDYKSFLEDLGYQVFYKNGLLAIPFLIPALLYYYQVIHYSKKSGTEENRMEI